MGITKGSMGWVLLLVVAATVACEQKTTQMGGQTEKTGQAMMVEPAREAPAAETQIKAVENTAGGMAAQVVEGKMAPAFTLTDTHGKTHSLGDFRGKYVVLEWTNPDCPFVKKHYDSGNMQSLQKQFTQKGVVWLVISSSAPGKQGHFDAPQWNEILKSKESGPSALLLDEDGRVGKAYGAKTTPHMFVIDPQGRILYDGAIDDMASTRVTDIPKSRNYVVMTLDEAMAGKELTVSHTTPYGCSVKYP
ncbi:MAG: thioredoxin family protein [Phycisphaeraceae bacterium]|nr:thioredoxin family protein [Phycisphaeraceae bacterium]